MSMDYKEIELKVINLLKEVLNDKESLDGLTSEDGISNIGLNSISFIRLVVLIEQEFEIEFDDNLDYNKFSTLGDLITFVQNKI
jgi:acyl carrier protein